MAQKLTYEKVLAMFAETDRRLDKRFAETDRRFKETDAFLKEKFAETDKLIKDNAREIGGISDSNGAFAEEIFYNSLEKRLQLGAEKFTDSEKHVKVQHGDPLQTLGEYDIQLSAKGKIAIIEIKYKVTPAHLKKLLYKADIFYTAFSDQENTKIYLGIAGLSFAPNAEKMARDRGIAVLKLKGDALEDKNYDLFPLTKDNLPKTWTKWAEIVDKERNTPVPKKTLGKTAKKAPAKRTAKKK